MRDQKDERWEIPIQQWELTFLQFTAKGSLMKLHSGVSFSSTAARTRQHARKVHVRQGGRRDHQTILTGNGRCSRTWGCPNPTTSAHQRAKRRKDCSGETRISTDGATAAARSQSLLGFLYLSLCQPKLHPPPESEPISSSDSVLLLLPSTERTKPSALRCQPYSS
jgi:hypothetical protein